MKNAGLAGAIALCGIGLIMIGLGNFVSTPRAMAAAPAVAQGDGEPTIVWYGMAQHNRFATQVNNSGNLQTITAPAFTVLARAWSDGLVEAKRLCSESCTDGAPFDSGWYVVSSPTEGLNAAADITFDEVVDGQDLAVLLARWGDAPRNPMPPSDCPLGLLN